MTNGVYWVTNVVLGRAIGIDLGLKRTGLAVTDPEKRIATPLDVVDTRQLMAYLSKYIPKEAVDTIVLGLPLKPDGSPTHTTNAVRKLQEELGKAFPDIEIRLVDERFTTTLAQDAMITGGTKKKFRREKGNLDKISATIILQSFLEQRYWDRK